MGIVFSRTVVTMRRGLARYVWERYSLRMESISKSQYYLSSWTSDIALCPSIVVKQGVTIDAFGALIFVNTTYGISYVYRRLSCYTVACK